MNRNAQTLCPACNRLPEWQWTLFTEADDFCEDHAWQRYPAIPITNEEVEEARNARAADEYGWYGPLEPYFPNRPRRCRACGHEWIGTPNEYHFCRMGMEGEMVFGRYTPNEPDMWDDDRFASPKHMGTHKQSH